MLAIGLTDGAIARQLGRHPRTVQRHVRQFMNDLGTQTRFHAGLPAGRGGLSRGASVLRPPYPRPGRIGALDVRGGSGERTEASASCGALPGRRCSRPR
jgi:hypothetical protein